MFESYFLHQRSYFETVKKSLGFSFILHIVIFCIIFSAPFLVIRKLDPPLSALAIFETLPPPPPPPLGNSVQQKTLQEKIKPQKQETLKEPDKVSVETPPPPAPSAVGIPEGAEGGIEGGVVGGIVSMPLLVKAQQKISGDMPVFPAEARAQGLSATIAARICISAAGNVTSVKILRGSPAFDTAVQKALSTWKYAPYLAGNTAIPACFPAYFNFNLKE